MWQTPAIPEAARAGRRVPVLVLAVGLVTVLALIDILAEPQLVILGTLTTGPCLAACAGRPRVVLTVGAYVLILINAVSWWPDRIWGSAQHLMFNLFAVAVTAVGMGIAHSLRTVERARVTAENEWRTLAAIVAHSDDAILAATLGGRLTAFNSGAERLYGYPAADMIGLPLPAFAALVVPVDAPGRPPTSSAPGSSVASRASGSRAGGGTGTAPSRTCRWSSPRSGTSVG